MARRTFIYAGIVGAVALALGAFSLFDEPSMADSRAMALPVHPVRLIAETASGEKSISIEIADQGSERAAGLMFRENMPDDHGMLFVFEKTQPVGFWMKDTPMPLDLLFVGEDGVVRDIERGEPLSEAVISPGEPVRFVLELKAGMAGKLGIADGDQLRHPAIAEAPGVNSATETK